MYKMLLRFEEYYEIDLKDSGCMQQKKNLPIIQDGKIVLHGKYLLPMSLKEI
jgi:hypothetical protein